MIASEVRVHAKLVSQLLHTGSARSSKRWWQRSGITGTAVTVPALPLGQSYTFRVAGRQQLVGSDEERNTGQEQGERRHYRVRHWTQRLALRA